MTDYNKRYSTRGSENSGRRDIGDYSRQSGHDVHRSASHRSESIYADRSERRDRDCFDDSSGNDNENHGKILYSGRFGDLYEDDRYEDDEYSVDQNSDYYEDDDYDSGPQRFQDGFDSAAGKQDRAGLIVLAVLVVFIIMAVIICVNVWGSRRASDVASISDVATTMSPVPSVQATETPQPTVTPVPTPETRMSSEYVVLDGIPDTDRELGLQECEWVPDSYFDDAVFIGDSVTLKLNYYVRDARKEGQPTLLGSAQFLTAGSLGSREAMKSVSSDSLHPSYRGQKMLLEDSVAAMGAKKVFIMLGMNDVALYGVEDSAKNMMMLIKRIVDKSPGVKVFIQSATPRIEGNYNKLNNNALFEYDLKLYEYCRQLEEYDIFFVDVAHALRDEKGNLPLEYCSDSDGMGLHFTAEACKEWIKYLYTHALV